MEVKQYRLCEEVLRRFQRAGVLDGMVVAGSWCLLFYQSYFESEDFAPTIRTRDLDFAVPVPSQFSAKADVGELLSDLGFVVDYRGDEGYIRFLHPDLILEFLVPERGRGSERPFEIPELGVNAQRLRYLDLSLEDTIEVDFRGIPIRLPHPARFAIHKLIVASRRPEKAENDRNQAIMVLRMLEETGKQKELQDILSALPKKWQKTARESFLASGDPGAQDLAKRLMQ